MILSINVWVKEEDATKFASVYESINKGTEVLTDIPVLITDKKETEVYENGSLRTYVQFYVPYNIYLDIITYSTQKKIPENDMYVLKNIIDVTAQFGKQYVVMYAALSKLKENSSLGIIEAIDLAWRDLIQTNTE